jgi:hypothetical protein
MAATKKTVKAKGPYLGDFTDVLNYVRERLAIPARVPSPFTRAKDFVSFDTTVAVARKLLPERYQATYVDVLAKTVELAKAQIEQIDKQPGWRKKTKKQAVLSKLEEVFATLAAAVVQLDSHLHETELKAYLALASNLFQRFQTVTVKPGEVGLAMPQIDPLGFFTDATAGSEPGIWSASKELPVALVSKPANQMNCLPIWVIDGHEVGGHGIYDHLDGFDQDIAQALSQAVGQTTGKVDFKPKLPFISGHPVELIASSEEIKSLAVGEFYKHIVRAYSQELAADTAGVLNMGPMFVNGLIIYLAKRRHNGVLSHTSPLVDPARLNVYPADILRALVAIEALKLLELKNGGQWQTLLRARLLKACGGSLPEHFSFVAEQGIFKTTVPTADIVALVPTIAFALMKSKLPSLGGRALSEVLSWNSLDDELTEAVSQRLTDSTASFSLADLNDIEARHVSAAALQALERVMSQDRSNLNLVQQNQIEALAARIDRNGLDVLKGFYLEQCILCAIPAYGKTRSGTVKDQLWHLPDLLDRVRNFNNQN